VELSRYSDWLRARRSGDRIPVTARFSAPVQTGPAVHPASCTTGTGSFPGGKERPGRDADPPPPSSTVGHERVELYLYTHMGRTACTELYCITNSLVCYMFLPHIEAFFRGVSFEVYITKNVYRNLQTQQHHLRSDSVTLHTACQHTIQHKQFYQYFTFYILTQTSDF